jgi:hypothetical protein
MLQQSGVFGTFPGVSLRIVCVRESIINLLDVWADTQCIFLKGDSAIQSAILGDRILCGRYLNDVLLHHPGKQSPVVIEHPVPILSAQDSFGCNSPGFQGIRCLAFAS